MAARASEPPNAELLVSGLDVGSSSWGTIRLIVQRVGRADFVVGVRSHTGEVLSVYLMNADIEKVVEFLSRKHD